VGDVTEGATQRRPTVTGFAVNCAIEALRKRDIAALPLLHRAGLSEQNFDNPQVRVPAGSQGDFLKYAAEAIGDMAFGLHLAEQADPRRAGLIFYAASSARTLGETLAVFLRYASLVNESLRLAMVSEPASVTVEFSFVGVSPEHVKQNTEFWTGMIIKAARQITGRHVRPIRVAYPHIRNTDLQEFARVFGCPVEFGAPTGQLVFANATLALPLMTHDPSLLETLQPLCEKAARERNTTVGSLRAAVENELQQLLPGGQATAAQIARALALSVRTLSRRLSSEGTTFAKVVEQFRHSLALQYLNEPGITLTQVAWLLGYENPTSFNHAFRRWTGRSPSAARKEKRHPAQHELG
jgi:AraC-like DNA-binding protein